MKILFFDTETTGLPRDYKAPITDLDNWPRMVQIAFVLTEEEGGILSRGSYLINHRDLEIPEGATAIHGITTERMHQEGQQLDLVLMDFKDHLNEADLIVGHNISFDRKIVGAEFLRCEMEDILHGKPRICTMFKSTKYCNIMGKGGRIKWPTLQELYSILFKEQMEGAHDAHIDVIAVKRCFIELCQRGVITDEMIQEQLNFKPVEGY